MIKWFRLLVAAGWVTLSMSVHAQSDADPWEGFNRAVYSFNDTLDRYLLKPVAKGYLAITPAPVQTGIGNFFNNLGDFTTIINDLLQAKFFQAGQDSTRFLVNSTVGIVGLVDVGSRIGLERHNEDFGQTLGYWGMGSGPYLMLPVLGPSTLRDGTGLIPEYFVSPLMDVDDRAFRYSLWVLDGIDTRARLFDAEKLIAGDRYTFLREAYLQRREFLVRDGVMEVNFDEDDDLFDDDDDLDD